ncbi:uncharacterized protein LOC133526529 [Cydia pomonella]|uniref:uncharacterized protein LOC133526529 n=1 Tax=Cydia pomonella TaxID=82600 RepID=UPI002ADD7998|nr:uncharacterized protein LOC133526529 [Cydia pomonella]
MDSGRLEAVPAGAMHLDTVRALHQTVVSLRTALEISKNELKELKQKYEQHSHCIEYADVIEKLTLENHILRRKIIDSGPEDLGSQKLKLEVTYSPHSQTVDDYSGSEVVVKTVNSEINSTIETLEHDAEYGEEELVSSDTKEPDLEEEIKSADTDKHSPIGEQASVEHKESSVEEQPSQVQESVSLSSYNKQTNDSQPTFQTKLELLSKFDVKIKVRTLKEGAEFSSTTSESGSTVEDRKDTEKRDPEATFHFEDRKEHLEDTEHIKASRVNTVCESVKMAVPNDGDAKKTDKFDVQVRITSEENLVVKEHVERSRRKDTLNLDVDDLSLRSFSEGDNSVFSEGVTTPIDPRGDEKETENASGNESEEVDDIELIFTTDESKDMSNLQEDLVSIRETDQWPPSASTTHSTPVLIKFHTLDPDFQPGETTENAENENQENSTLQGVLADSSLRIKRVSLPNDKEIRHVAFNSKGSLDLPGRGILKSCDNRSDNTLYKRSPNTSTRRLDSVDSLTCEYNRGLSFDNTKSSSFELGSSMDILRRDESVDSFHKTSHFGHRFSVFAERDISKCGTSEDDLYNNVRRNTCPNPFQYRPAGYRVPRGPLKASALGPRARPVLREAAGGAPRRDEAAQTDVCALPPRWSSDQYLASKISLPSKSIMPTLPLRSAPGRRLTVPAPKLAAPATSEDTRVLLSDIGFTSMVPELSRSADPVWALGLRASMDLESFPSEPSNYSKFLARSSRSPSTSVDRSYDRLPHYTPSSKVECRLWRGSLPDVRRDDTDELLEEAETYVRRSIDNLRSTSRDHDRAQNVVGQPYVPAEPRQLRLGHAVKLIAPHGRIAVGRVRYVGIAGGTAATSGVMVGAELPLASCPGLPGNDGTHRGRRYFLAAQGHTALFVPFSKVVMAWAN